MPIRTVHSGCTDPTQPIARLVIVLVSRIQKNGTGDNNFVMERDTSVRATEIEDRSKWATFKGSPKYSGRTEPKWSVPFDFQSKFPEFWAEWKAPKIYLRLSFRS